MARRRMRVKGRFYVFLALLLLGVVLLLRPHLHLGSRTDVIFTATAAYQETMDALIIRDEPVTASSSTVRVEYLAQEVSLVKRGESIANFYTTGYTENLLTRLETTRQNIQSYHKTLLGTIVDTNLDRLDAVIDMISLDFKNLALQNARGNLRNVVEQLQTAMVNRQEYLRQNKRDDNKLTKLYEEENARMSSIQSWRKVSNADRDGVVSFYLDGYENDLTPATIKSLTIQDIRAVLGGAALATTQNTRQTGICRIVDQSKWYVAVLIEGNNWTPMVGQDNYYMMMEGFDDLTFNAAVTSVQKDNGITLAVFEINNPMGPLIYRRTGRAQFSITLQGLAVRTEALYNDNGQMGVWVYDMPGGTFVPVEVLSTNGNIAMIQPLVDGSLELGQTVLIK